ncbi:MAG: hypothetical protein PSV22_00680 [Pseudolabrys sp.]|nr:hypothetical protein [Pseudolabrys sp.]
MDRNAEINEVRRELAILRARHALFARWGRILKAFFGFAMPLFAITLATAGVAFGGADPFIASFVTALMIVVCAIVYLIFSPRDPRRGWIDLASPPMGFAYPPKGIGAFLFAARPSDALVIEEQIAARERRLAELGVAL